MTDSIIAYHCAHVGVAGTTDVHVKRHVDGTFEARCGIALIGSTNMDEAGFKACNYDPFHAKFYDNYACGNGRTKEEAIERLKEDMVSLSRSII